MMEREKLKYRPHGFRATFRTWVEEQTDTPFEVAEAAIGHVVEGDVVRAYQRSDRLEKRKPSFGELVEVPIQLRRRSDGTRYYISGVSNLRYRLEDEIVREVVAREIDT